MTGFIFLGSKITADSKWSREIRRCWRGNPLQYSCLENSMDRGAWWATIHGVTKSQTLRDWVSDTESDWATYTLLLGRKAIVKLDRVLKSRVQHFADKSLCSQRYGFSSSNVWMWELDHKEGWASKNWCFWTVVFEKTLESPLDFKEIKPVNPKGNQPWIFIGRTDAEAEAPILQPPDMKTWLIRKDPDAGRDWR